MTQRASRRSEGAKERRSEPADSLAWRATALAVCLIAGGSSEAVAQGGPSGSTLPPPELGGQWWGPFPLESAVNPGGSDEWAEFVHLTVLPPPNDGHVLLWNRRKRDMGSPTPVINQDYSTWVWHPSRPTALFERTLPGTSSGAWDLFCGAQTYLHGATGTSVLAIGGTDMLAWQAGLTEGSPGTFEFDNGDVDAGGGAWTQRADLPGDRYYPGCLRETNGEVVTFSSIGGQGTAPEAQNRDVFDGTSWTRHPNHELAPTASCQDPLTTYPLLSSNYPDIHVLRTGHWLRVDGAPTYLFDKTACTSADPPQERFVTWDSDSVNDERPQHFGTSVHYLYLDATGSRHEIVYTIGGNDAQGCGGEFSANVLRMEDPTVGKVWDDTPPDLNVPRHTANTIILLDGSMLVIGGANDEVDDDDECDAVLEVERFKPPKIFATPNSQWKLMSPLTQPRTYHSTAGLLSDGTVVSAGGVGLNHGPEPAWYSLGRYLPPYFFASVQRPEITNVTATEWGYLDTLQVDVAMMNEATGEYRVALLSPCSGTHGVDFNQRYIELPSTLIPVGSGASISVTAPEDSSVAPPGAYMLTVVNKQGVPSAAKWITVE